jgi:hypothetical protein
MKTGQVYRERLKFYADTGREKNKLFTWDLPNGILSLKETLHRFFSKGWSIRAGWYEKIDLRTGKAVENTRLNIAELLDEYLDGLSAKKQGNSY